jgi:RecB family endonuclease NucS
MQELTAIELAQLQRVDLRQVWLTEDDSFTPWLASNIHFLGDAIGMNLEVLSREQAVGAFRADILAKDTLASSWVLIENQLERTDHIHLGQLITYASGLKAVIIIWIACQFTE